MALDASYEKLLEKLEGFTVHDEDGQPRLFRGLPGMTPEEIQAWEAKSGFKLPEDYRRFIMSWDGAEAGEFEILPHSTSIAIETGMLPLHVWGNGDIDCLDLKQGNHGAVVFLNRESNSRPVIAPTFALWLAGVIRELDYHGTLFHPFLDARPGFYRKALGRTSQKTIVRLEEPGNWVYWIFRKFFRIRHGTLTWWHRSGEKKREAVYRFNKLKRETCWRDNGVKLSETFYISEDAAHGPQTSWHPNGRIKTQRVFVQGHLEGKESSWNEHGQLVSEKMWKWSRLLSESFFNPYTNTVEETIYADKDGERVVSETRTRKISDPPPGAKTP